MYLHGIAGLLNPDCNPIWWIGLWIVIDNPKSKLDFGFGFSIQFCHFIIYLFIKIS